MSISMLKAVIKTMISESSFVNLLGYADFYDLEDFKRQSGLNKELFKRTKKKYDLSKDVMRKVIDLLPSNLNKAC